MPRLCLNGIVRNESGRILRMLDSVRDVISTFAILDTGSTDNTVELLEEWGKANGIKGLVGKGAFVDFSQARNQALDMARSWHRHDDSPAFDYLLLVDADMELKIEAPASFDDLRGEAYEMMQKAGDFSYNNIRLVSAKSDARYTGVTHEYLNVAAAGVIAGAHFIDHADGANRPDKFERDVRLLNADLLKDPNNGRSWFYLANTYRDMGEWDKAERCYRTKLDKHPTWPEEDWMARVYLAQCMKEQGTEAAFIFESLKAYQARPVRAEPLHDLAKFFRARGENATASLFAEAGIGMSRPDDKLFVQDWVYDWGMREEFSIAGYYSEKTRDRAFRINNDLALDPKVPSHLRHGARTNMVWYLKPLKSFCPSYADQEINFTPSPGFTAMNPCVTSRPDGGLEVLVRTVNYRIDEHGRYMIGEKGCWDAPIETENWLVQLDGKLWVRSQKKVKWDRPPAKFDKVIGLEDMRIYWFSEDRLFIACSREQLESGMPQQLTGELRDCGAVCDVEALSDGSTCEKNWSPIYVNETEESWPEIRYIYRLDKIVTFYGDTSDIPTPLAVENISGGSPYIPFFDGHLAIVHEAVQHPAHGKRIYQHRFAWYDADIFNLKLSIPFVFHDVQIEFAAGIARIQGGKDIVISFGERDAKAWLATVGADEVAAMLGIIQ